MLLATLRTVIRIATAIAVLSALAGASGAGAATLQEVGVFERPMYVTSAPNNPNRLFVVERRGRIVELQNGVASTFADLSPVTSCCDDEQGLQSIALARDFATSGRLFVFYTGFEGEIHVAEMRASGASAPLGSRRDLLTIPHPSQGNHYGGQLQIGPEGLLYVSTGDGGGSDDQLHNAQSLGSLLGKILRIDPNSNGVLPYSVPAGNPFPGLAAPYDTIWSLGLRNPYRFSFDAGSGAMLIGDVGQGAREEVDYAPPPQLGAGANYGWNCREGGIAGPGTDPECATPPPGGYQQPIFDYPHDNPGGAEGCAIVGGYVVRDPNLGGLYGRYLYGDFCGGALRSFDVSAPAPTDRPVGLAATQLTTFGEDACNRLYVASAEGRVWRLAGNDGASACPAAKPRSASFVGIRAQGRRVKKGRRAQITAWVSPCAGRRGEPVRLMRGRARLGTRRLDRACTVRFRPKISRKAKFRAVIAEDANYVSATSRKLRIKIDRRKSAKRRG
jgi:hypothetical protein